jgi:hypothetical protein
MAFGERLVMELGQWYSQASNWWQINADVEMVHRRAVDRTNRQV